MIAKSIYPAFLWGSLLSILFACSDQNGQGKSSPAQKPENRQVQGNSAVVRWYTAEQVSNGGRLYQQHCAACHKADASGTQNWKQPDSMGRYPPPPLNGSAHSWHHPMKVLRSTLRHGGVPLGGWMPAFKDKLSDEQIDSVIAWFQSHWSDEIYLKWAQRFKQ